MLVACGVQAGRISTSANARVRWQLWVPARGGGGRRPGGTSPEQLWAVPAYGGLQWPRWFLHGCVCSAVAVSSQWGRARLMQWPGGGGRRPVTAPDCACAGDEACTSYAAINDPGPGDT